MGRLGRIWWLTKTFWLIKSKKFLDLLAKFSMSGIIKPQDLVNLTHAKI